MITLEALSKSRIKIGWLTKVDNFVASAFLFMKINTFFKGLLNFLSEDYYLHMRVMVLTLQRETSEIY